MTEQWIIAGAVTIWLVVCAVLDARHGEVTNWLTIPGMAAGIFYVVIMGGDRLILLAAVLVGLILLFIIGSMGSADVKGLTALAGLWPTALFSALVVQGIWGIVVRVRRGRGNEFRAIPAYAFGALLSTVLLV
jgi:Flp pilus assembly protein protease CpaA